MTEAEKKLIELVATLSPEDQEKVLIYAFATANAADAGKEAK